MQTFKRARSFCPLALWFVAGLLLNGCKSTPDATAEDACIDEVTPNCESEDELKRGYDPCLVNKSLPVCES